MVKDVSPTCTIGVSRTFLGEQKTMPLELRYPLFYLRGEASDYAIPLGLDTVQAKSVPLFDCKEAADTFRSNKPATEFTARPIPEENEFIRFLHHLQANDIMLLMFNPTGEDGEVETLTVGEMLQRFQTRPDSR